MNLRKIIFAIVFVLVINSVVAEEFPQAGITPDSFLYNLERIWERIQLRLTFNPTNRVRLRLLFAEERMLELDEMIRREKLEFVENLLKDKEGELDEADVEIEKLKIAGIDTTSLLEHLSNMTYKHVEVLERVLERVPESARPAIEKAINLSVARHENCIERLLEKINKTIENVRKFNCTINTDCMRLLCPMVIGYDTPLCEDGKCTCGPKWKIANVTRWRERFQEEIRARIEEKIRIGYGK
ncbi:MAG: DUF5667 domain-containing protein [Candidatus Aenigmatarchaeota archaeon]